MTNDPAHKFAGLQFSWRNISVLTGVPENKLRPRLESAECKLEVYEDPSTLLLHMSPSTFAIMQSDDWRSSFLERAPLLQVKVDPPLHKPSREEIARDRIHALSWDDAREIFGASVNGIKFALQHGPLCHSVKVGKAGIKLKQDEIETLANILKHSTCPSEALCGGGN